MARKTWIDRAEELLDLVSEELQKKLADMQPEQLIAIMAAVGQRVTTHRAVVVEADGEPDGPAGDRGDRAPAKRRAKGSRSKGKGVAARGRRSPSASSDVVDPADQPTARIARSSRASR